MRQQAHIAVVGGGIAGLAAALRLEELARAGEANSSTKVSLLEATPTTGGKLVTTTASGFIIDEGADIFLASKPGAVQLAQSVGLEDELVPTDPDRRRTFERDGHSLRAAQHYADERLVTPRGGMQRLPEAAARALQNVDVTTSVRVSALDERAGQWLLTTDRGSLLADAVVLAVPGSVAARLLARVNVPTSDLLNRLLYRSVIVISAGFDAADCTHALDGYGYMVPEAPVGEVSACTWTSSKIPGRAPQGTVLLRGYIHADATIPEADATATVLQEFRNTLGIQAPPRVLRARAWRDAVVRAESCPRGHSDAIRTAIASSSALSIAGASLDGAGIPDAIMSGRRAADDVWHSLFDPRLISSS
jgi:protoporphyrinogen oxidase